MQNLMPKFEDKKYDVTNYFELICGCCLRTTLEMGMNEVTLKKKNPCYKSRQRRPYAQLTTVQLHKTCCKICVTMGSDLTPVAIDENGEVAGGNGLTSGCGCDAEKMQEITDELKKRQIGRGAVAQVKQQDFLIAHLITRCMRAQYKQPYVTQSEVTCTHNDLTLNPTS